MTIGLNPAKLAETIPNSEKILKEQLICNCFLCVYITDYTYGAHCELCVPGSFGNATTSEGCKPCQCNGHGDPDKHFCDMTTGQCYCTDFTMGFHCDKCMPGLMGNPT